MTNEPKAGDGLDPEVLAAYLDKRLPPDERAAVEAKLATDPDSYELLVELIHANEALRDEASRDEEAKTPGERPEEQGAVVPLVPRPQRTRGWAIAGGLLAVAAALVLVVRLQPDLLQRLGGGDAVDPQLAKLVAAVGEERYIEARLTGGFKYGPLRATARGADVPLERNLSLAAAAAGLRDLARSAPTPENRHAWGIAQLLLGNYDAAADTLREVAEQSERAAWYSDLSTALLVRAGAVGRPVDLSLALAAAERAVALDPGLLEARFNLALIAQRAGLPHAAQYWADYLAEERSAEWRAEAEKLREESIPQ